MGNRRAAHAHNGSKICHTLFPMAQDPEYPYAAAVTQLLEYICHHLKIFDFWDILGLFFNELPVVMGQMAFAHSFLLLLFWYILSQF